MPVVGVCFDVDGNEVIRSEKICGMFVEQPIPARGTPWYCKNKKQDLDGNDFDYYAFMRRVFTYSGRDEEKREIHYTENHTKFIYGVDFGMIERRFYDDKKYKSEGEQE